MKYYGYILPVAALLCGCGQKTTRSAQGPDLVPDRMQGQVIVSQPRNVVAPATVFKMSGHYADHVAVTLGSDGQLTYFPAPTDLTAASAPVEIGDGWWFNRQGLSANSVFTRWTFAEYRALPTVPSPSEIKAAIIPGARVTDFRQLPIPASEAAGLPPADLLKYIK